MNEKQKILVVEDELAIRTGIMDLLTFHGFQVHGAEDGRKGLTAALEGGFDLVLLDVMMPAMNGFDVCDEIRKLNPEQPIIMLTAKVSEEDIIAGLRLGADDYIAKPFSVTELVLRVEAVLRRTNPGRTSAASIAVGSLQIDAANLCASDGEKQVMFTRREMEILQHLHRNHERPVSRDELLEEVWGYARHLQIETRTVDIHIAKLRRKLEADSKNPEYLITVRGAGYRLLSEA